jgi:ABC-type glycerol-3-phosphate transport system permease component
MKRGLFATIMMYVVLVVFAIYALVPLFWALSTAFKDEVTINSSPPTILPIPLYLKNFQTTQFSTTISKYLINSFIVALGTIFLSEVVAFFAAYSAARFDFKGKDLILFVLWATIMIPGISVIIPLYVIATNIGLYDTYFVLILVYAAWLTPTITWLLRGFIASIPPSMEESAIMDGCSRVMAIWYVVAPLARPGLASAAVLGFLTVWNDFLIAYTLTISDGRRTLQTGLYHMITDWGIEWGPMMAATITAILPIIIIFLFLQRSFIQGLTKGGTKF